MLDFFIFFPKTDNLSLLYLIIFGACYALIKAALLLTTQITGNTVLYVCKSSPL